MGVLDINIDEGTLIVGLELPWPPQWRVLFEQTLVGGALVIRQLPNGRIIVELYQELMHNMFIIDDVISCPIICHDYNKIFIGVIWKAKKIILMRANYNTLFDIENKSTIVDKIDIRLPDKKDILVRDFSVQNQVAINHRSERLKNWRGAADRIHGGKEYAFNSLSEEILQLRDLINLVESGKYFHFLGLMSRVRLLLIGKPLGLLQLCAAYLDAPLNVYGHASSDEKYPVEADAVVLLGSIHADDGNVAYQSIMDIDVWLGCAGLRLSGREYDNLSIIREIGNTVASHRDLDIQKSVSFLSSGGDQVYRNIVAYSVMLSSVVLSLSEELINLSRNSAPTSPK